MISQQKCFAIFAIVLLALAGQGDGARKTLATDANCSAFAFLNIEVTGGSCTGEAGADCAAVSRAQSEYQKAFDTWLADEDSACDSGKASAAASAIAKAIAEVWANAFVKVDCQGEGFACGYTIAEGDAWAKAFAEAIAQVGADVSTENAVAVCVADIKAITAVVADVAAKAKKDVCTNGGRKEDFEEAYAKSIQTALAEAFATATAFACGDNSQANARTKCKGGASVQTDSFRDKKGDAKAEGGKVDRCPPAVTRACCGTEYTNRICICRDCEGSWTRTSDFEGSEKRSWVKSSGGDKCFCT